MATQVDTKKRVLLVFNDKVLLSLFRRILQSKLSLDILEAADMDTAKKIIYGTKIHLIILGDWIDRQPGVKFARLICKQLEFKKIPIILFSIGDQHKIDEAEKTSLDIVFATPNDLQELISVVRSLLEANG